MTKPSHPPASVGIDPALLWQMVNKWTRRLNEIAATLSRCDSAKAYEVLRCRDELAEALLADRSSRPQTDETQAARE